MPLVCEPCDHAWRHGWFGPTVEGGTHCGGADGCHRSWRSPKEAHCTVCHQHFSADSAADLHEPHCSRDRAATREGMQAACTRGGNPVFDRRSRAGGEVWVRWTPAGSHPRVGKVSADV